MFGQLVNESTLPIRKRRRPALSCIECRRRKIKCDRNLPCNHCKQTKNSECLYKSLHSASPNRRSSPITHVSLAQKSSVEDSSQRATEVPLANDSPYQYSSYQGLSTQASPIVPGWSKSERSSNENDSSASTSATTFDDIVDDAASLHEQGLARSERKEQLLPDAMHATDEEMKGTRWQKALGICFSTFNDVIVEDGNNTAKIRTKFFNSDDLTPIQELRGSVSKTRFFGQSHWMNSFQQFTRITSCSGAGTLPRPDPARDEANIEVRRLLEQCKTMARKIKAERSVQWHMNPDFKDYVPSRELADKLIEHYLRTMESSHRILHVPQFLREYDQYWKNPEKAATASVVKIVLVMAIGSCFYQEADSAAVRAAAQQWVYSAQAWVSAPFEKGRLNLSGLQIHCLLMIARQTTALGGDLLWTAAGSLLRSAFQMGLHRDPKYFPKMSILHGELRRRLWATVLELTIQTALDTGMPPLITANDFDTGPPANLNDVDLSENTSVMPTAKPPHVFTQSSLQIQMLKSIQTRLHISRLLNDFTLDPSYDQILSLGSEMSKACNESSLLVQSYPTHLPHPSPLQRNVLDMMLRRFLIAIHRPFAIKSQSDPRYYFSRKVTTDAALAILCYSSREAPTSPPVLDSTGKEVMDDFTRLRAVGGAFYKETILYAGILVCLELVLQLEEDAASGVPPSPSSIAARQPLLRALDDMVELITTRIKLGENNVKGLLFIEAVRGQIHAMEAGTDVDQAIVEFARLGARKCIELLRTRLSSSAPGPSEPATGTGAGGNGTATGTHAGAGTWQDDMLGGAADYGYDFMMQDVSPEDSLSGFNFDIPDSWLFAGWGANSDP